MRKFKNALLFAFFLLIVITLRPALAQAPALSPTPPSSNQTNLYSDVNPNVPHNLHTLTQSTVIELLSTAICIASGRDPLNPQGSCLGVDPKSGKIGYSQNQGGIAPVMGSLIGSTINIPISSADYASYAMDNFGITKTYAQTTTNTTGLGFDRLHPLVSVWARFRDVSYLVFVIGFTIIGLAIVFRVKIDARTVMTIQNQIPKIVMALIMVTFSYAIAGFLIDMMYVVTYLFIITFTSLTPTHVDVNANVFSVLNRAFQPSIHNNELLRVGGGGLGAGSIAYDVGTSGIMNLSLTISRQVITVFTSITTDFLSSTMAALFKIPFTPFNALDLGCEVWGNTVGAVFGGIGNITHLSDIPVIGGLFGSPDCNFAQSFFEGTIAFIFGAIAFLVVLIAILYTLFRVWFTLIKSFAYILIDAMLGPLWITAGIFPGSKLNFSSWIRHLMGHLSVFPMTFGIILLGKTIMDGIASGQGQLFSPPLIGDALGGNSTIAAFVGFGFIISIPNILDKTRKTIGAIDFGLTDLKKAFNAANPLAAAQQGSQMGGTLFGLSHIPGVNKLPLIKSVTVGGKGNVAEKSVDPAKPA